jgi:1-phosphofructokinase family hexose kinase
VCVIGVVQESSQLQFSRFLDSMGIAAHLLTAPGLTRINATILEEKAGQATHVNSAQDPVPASLQDELLRSVQSRVCKGDLCVCSGSIPRDMGGDLYRKLIRLCRDKGAEVLLDAGGDALKFGIRARPHMIKPNLMELEAYFGEKVEGVRHIALKGKRLVDMGIGYVFISLGADGMIAIHENDCLLCCAPAVRAVDTVGCGDALVGGILAGYARKFSFTEMCRMAVACGSSKALHAGPASLSRDEVWRLMEEVRIKAV